MGKHRPQGEGVTFLLGHEHVGVVERLDFVEHGRTVDNRRPRFRLLDDELLALEVVVLASFLKPCVGRACGGRI